MVSNKEIKNRLKAKRESKNPVNFKSSENPNNGLICPNCGINNPDYASFCLDCGKSFPSSNKPHKIAESLGYVACDVCHGIYELQEGESFEDFESCQCGGNLTYINNINELEAIKDDPPKSEKNFGYVVCDVCFGVHKLSEFDSAANYETCPCGGNYTYIKEIGNIENPTKICVLCDSENPFSADRCSQCGKIFKDYIEYLQTKPYDIEITDNNIRVYHKKNKTILKVNKYDRAKIINFRLTDSFMRKNMEFNYGDHDISLSISANQAKHIEKFMKLADFQYFVCLSINCKYNKFLKESQKCPVCGNASEKISSDLFEQLKHAKHQANVNIVTEEKIRTKERSEGHKSKMKEGYDEEVYGSENTIKYYKHRGTLTSGMPYDIEITDTDLIVHYREKGLLGPGNKTGKIKVFKRSKMEKIKTNWALAQLYFDYDGKHEIISVLRDYLNEVEKILTNQKLENPEGIIKIAKGFNGQLELYDHKIIIKRKGAWAFVTQGFKGDKEILLNHISSIQLKKVDVTKGYIQFGFIGGLEAKRGVSQAVEDENTILFEDHQEKDFLEIKEMIESKMLEIQGKGSNKTVKTDLNEIEKLAELRDKGIITEEEFQAKKKQILGL